MQEVRLILFSILFMTLLSLHPRDFDTLPQNIYPRWRVTDWLITWELIRLPIQIEVSISVVARMASSDGIVSPPRAKLD